MTEVFNFCGYFSSILPHIVFFDFESYCFNRLFGGLLIFKFLPVSPIHNTIEVGNKIALGAIVKPIVCVHFLNTDLTKSGI